MPFQYGMTLLPQLQSILQNQGLKRLSNKKLSPNLKLNKTIMEKKNLDFFGVTIDEKKTAGKIMGKKLSQNFFSGMTVSKIFSGRTMSEIFGEDYVRNFLGEGNVRNFSGRTTSEIFSGRAMSEIFGEDNVRNFFREDNV